jgi:hypothetical protein
VTGGLRDRLARTMTGMLSRAEVPETRYRLEVDAGDPDRQTLLFWYPTVTADAGDPYVRSTVKIEAGAKSALDPHAATSVVPYVAGELPDLALRVAGITTVDPRRTFWDKVVILHGLRRWHDRRGQLRHEGQRVSRHYYDVFRMLQSALGDQVVADLAQAADCARHARMFFNSPDLDLDHAAPGSFALTPSAPMREPLARDYDAMAGMIMGPVPAFDLVVEMIAALERRINAPR